MEIVTINPTTEEIINKYPEDTLKEVDAKLKIAETAFESWSRSLFEERTEYMWKLADLIDERKHIYAQLMAMEMGKPISQSVAELDKCSLVCRWYADNAEEFLANEIIPTKHDKSYVCYRPLGAILAIMPWNYPFWQVLRFAAPTVMAANVCVLKHSNNTTACSLAIHQLFLDAGFPEGIFTSLVIDVDKVKEVIKHPVIKGITFTGSTKVGKIVAAHAGSVMKKCVFELGGSDPYVIFDDADLELAADQITNARFTNSGQTCISPKRVIVTGKRINKLTTLLQERTDLWSCGDPLREETRKMGPIARKDLLIKLEDQVKRSIDAGAKLICGGKREKGRGYFYQPTILTNVKADNPAYNEELFGPIITIIEAKDERNALEIANDSKFGLGAAIYSKNINRAIEIGEEQLRAGAIAINGIVKSDPRLPFGGIKDSGYGRELGKEGIREFVNAKTICVK